MFIIPINCPIVRHRIHFIVQEQHRVYGLRSRLLSHALRFNWNSWPSAGLGSWPVDALAGYSSADRHSFRVIHNNIIGRIKDALLWANILGELGIYKLYKLLLVLQWSCYGNFFFVYSNRLFLPHRRRSS